MGVIQEVLAIEARYPDGQITDPVEREEAERLIKEAIALDEQIEREEARVDRGRIICSGVPRSGRERVLIDPRDEGC
jgi:hypothetical protein